jgi:hypothetical protein
MGSAIIWSPEQQIHQEHDGSEKASGTSVQLQSQRIEP